MSNKDERENGRSAGKIKLIEISIGAGVVLEEAVRFAHVLCLEHECRVEFTFNDVNFSLTHEHALPSYRRIEVPI